MGIDGLSAIAPPRGFADPEVFNAQRDEKAYKEFEALFIKQLLKEMQKTVPDGGLFEKSSEMDTYEEMLDGAFAQAMADSGQFGIAKQIEEQVRLQEEQRAQSVPPLPRGRRGRSSRNAAMPIMEKAYTGRE